MSLYKTCNVMLYNTCYVCFITYVMLRYITYVMLGRGRTVAFFFLCRVICCPTNMSRHLRHRSLGGRTCGT